MKGHPRGVTPESIHDEVAGHVLLDLLTRWLMAEAARQARSDGDPLGISFQHAHEKLEAMGSILIQARPAQARKIVQNIKAQIAQKLVP